MKSAPGTIVLSCHVLKRPARSRIFNCFALPIPKTLERALAGHLARVAPGPNDLVFPGEYQGSRMRRVWDQACRAAGIANATPHDARHTFGVHAAQSGVPLVRLQKLMGHATPIMTLRHMKHAPEAYLDEDAATIEQHMSGNADREAAARASAARKSLTEGVRCLQK